MKHRLLVVDDEAIQLASLREFLEKRGFDVDAVEGGARAIAMARKNPNRYSLVILDYQMQGMNGAETTKALLEINPQLFVLIFSADPARDAFLGPSRLGARAFVDKSEGADFFLREVSRLCKEYEERNLTVSDKFTQASNQKLIASLGMVGRSNALAETARRVVKLQDVDGPVLILGETGTGKELIASALHQRCRGPFIAVNCADFLMNPDTATSKLFGHVKGAFTGAIANKEGVIEAAQDGTLYLDEIYALPPEAQVGLLRVLEARKVSPLGSHAEIEVRCRIVASAKPDLLKLVGNGVFKADLFYRVSENIVSIPSLAERTEDVGPLVAHFCSLWSKRYGVERTFLASTIPYLERYWWPGNARELKNVVFSLLNTSEKARISPSDLDPRFRNVGNKPPAVPGSLVPMKNEMEEAEKEHFLEVLRKSRSLRDAAKRLCVAPSTVLRRLRKLDLEGDAVIGSGRVDQQMGTGD